MIERRTTTKCPRVSVQIWRQSDEYLIDQWLPFLMSAGRALDVGQLRACVEEARAKGLRFVPLCSNTDPETGECLGHDDLHLSIGEVM